MSALPKYVHVDHRIITGVIDRLSNKNSASEWLRWMIDDVLADLTGQEKQYPPPRDALFDLRELGKLYGQAVFYCTPYTDLFGLIYMDLASRSTKSGLGQFFTPQVVTDMMAKMVGHQAKLPKDRLLTCLEPCCGSGVMLLSFARQIYADHGPGGLSRCGLYAIDLDITCCCMTAAQLLANAYTHEAPYGELLVLRGNALADSEDWITVVHATHPELEQAPANVVSVVQSAQTAAKNDPTLAARIDAHGQIAFDF